MKRRAIKTMYIMQMKSLKENNYHKATSHLFCSTFHFIYAMCVVFIVWLFSFKLYENIYIREFSTRKWTTIVRNKSVLKIKFAWMWQTIANGVCTIPVSLLKSILKFNIELSFPLTTSDTIFSSSHDNGL